MIELSLLWFVVTFIVFRHRTEKGYMDEGDILGLLGRQADLRVCSQRATVTAFLGGNRGNDAMNCCKHSEALRGSPAV